MPPMDQNLIPREPPSGRPTREEILGWLTWAGQKLLALPMEKIKPKAPGSCWPDYALDPAEAYGYSPAALRASVPTPAEITMMDKILSLPEHCSNPLRKRIVNARALVHPVNERNLYSYVKIAKLLRINSRDCRRWHMQALDEIATAISPKEFNPIRIFFFS